MLTSSLVLFLIAQAALPAPPALDIRRLTLSAPSAVVAIDAVALQGQPAMLAWSPDGRELYLRLVHTDRWGNERVRHFVVALAEKRLAPVAEEPAWSAAYWLRKSALAAPGAPEFTISVESRQERRTATGVVSAGGMAQSGGDPNLGAELGPQGQAIVMSAIQAQQVRTTTLRLKGDLLGEFVNTSVVQGLTYGWSPSGAIIAFAGPKQFLELMDSAGRKRDVREVKDVLLPAWSEDLTRLACLQRKGRNKFAVTLLDVSAR